MHAKSSRILLTHMLEPEARFKVYTSTAKCIFVGAENRERNEIYGLLSS